jgi:SAM-dependent methyltransferase
VKQEWPAPERNKAPILDVLREVLTEPTRLLEVASGTGQHAVHLAAALPHIQWHPSDLSDASLHSIQAYREEAGLANFHAPRRLNTTAWPEDLGVLDAVFCANMIHIAPFAAAEGLISGAGQSLRPGGQLILYGPYRFDGVFTAPSNEAFDRSLKSRDPSWGVRDLGDIAKLASEAGFGQPQVRALPANNHMITFGLGT